MIKTYSVKKVFRYVFLIIVCTVIIITLLYGLYSIRSYTKQMMEFNTVSLNSYAQTLSTNLSSIKYFIRNTTYNNRSCKVLGSANSSPSQRVLSQYDLRNFFKSNTLPYAISMIYDKYNNNVEYTCGDSINNQSNWRQLNHNIHTICGKINENVPMYSDSWQLLSDNHEDYFYIIYSKNNLYLCSLFSPSAYYYKHPLETYSMSGSVVFSIDDKILTNKAYITQNNFSLSELTNENTSFIKALRSGYFINSVFLKEYHLHISVITPVSEVASLIFPYLKLSILIIILVSIIIYVIYQTLSHILLFPLNQITLLSTQWKNNETGGTPSLTHSKFYEFNQIQHALIELLEKTAALNREREQKEHEREHALLQYYQMQTRSHFFLNCLKSLYSMLQTGERERMQNMILSFSNHLRYIFHDNLSLVTLEAEIKEITDYHRIISLDYTRIFLLNIDVPNELLDFKVPTLIIQTFLENTYKYNTKIEIPLIFNVKSSIISTENGQFLQLQVSDNGIGYAKDVLSRINEKISDSYDQYNIGINNLRRRMAILYSNNYYTYFHNLPKGGACSELYVPLVKDQTDI